jgi:hypothetical protein
MQSRTRAAWAVETGADGASMTCQTLERVLLALLCLESEPGDETTLGYNWNYYRW